MAVQLLRPIQLGACTMLPLSQVSVVLLLLAMGMTPAIGGPYLPLAETGLPVGANPLTASIDEHGRFFLRERSGWKPVSDSELGRRVRALAESRPGTKRLYVTADRDTRYGRVLTLADAARAAGIQELDLATYCPGGNESLLRACHP